MISKHIFIGWCRRSFTQKKTKHIFYEFYIDFEKHSHVFIFKPWCSSEQIYRAKLRRPSPPFDLPSIFGFHSLPFGFSQIILSSDPALVWILSLVQNSLLRFPSGKSSISPSRNLRQRKTARMNMQDHFVKKWQSLILGWN